MISKCRHNFWTKNFQEAFHLLKLGSGVEDEHENEEGAGE